MHHSTGSRALADLLRANVLLAERSSLSRRGADAAIAAGRLTTLGRRIALGEKLPGDVPLELDGAPLRAPAAAADPAADPLDSAEISAWHKPAGVTTTHADPFAAVTLPQALEPLLGPERAAAMLSVGRLDRETEGLLLLTPERRIVSRLAHPRSGLRRGYAVATRFSLGAPEFDRLRAGIRLTDGWARALDARPVRPADRLPSAVLGGDDDPGQWSYIELGEGRHHEVRRLYGAIGHPVLRLIRLSFGPVHLGDLQPGALRRLDGAEMASLRAAIRAPRSAAVRP